MLLEVEWPPLVNEIKAELLENEEVLNLLDIISIMAETSHHTIPMSGGTVLILAKPQEVGCQT